MRDYKTSAKFSLYLIITVILTLGLSISFQSILAAWTPPDQSAPDGNTPAPVYVSSAGNQTIDFTDPANTNIDLIIDGGLIVADAVDFSNGLTIAGGNVALGSNWLSGDGDNEGISIDGSGNITVSGTISGNGSGLTSLDWNSLINVPAGFADNTDDVGVAGSGDITAVYSGVGTKGGSTSGNATIEFDCSEAITGTTLACNASEQLYVPTDSITATQIAPASTIGTCSNICNEADPQVGTITVGGWCIGNTTSLVNCNNTLPVPRLICADVNRVTTPTQLSCTQTCASWYTNGACIGAADHGDPNFHGYVRDCDIIDSGIPGCRCCRISW